MDRKVSVIMRAVWVLLLSTITACASPLTLDKNIYFNNIIRVSSGIEAIASFNNKLFFGTTDSFFYAYDQKTGTLSLGNINLNNLTKFESLHKNALYVGSLDKNLYKIKAPVDKPATLEIFTSADNPIYATFANDDVGYFTSDDLYEFNPAKPNVKASKLTNINSTIYALLVSSFSNKIYLGSGDYNVYEYDRTTKLIKSLFKANNSIISLAALDDKVYFGSNDTNLFEYNSKTRFTKNVCNSTGAVTALTVLNNKVYAGSSYNVNEYNPATGECDTVATATGEIYGLATFKNKLYIGSNDANLYEYSEEINLESAILVNSLKQIANISNSSILNELNIVNPGLDINSLEIVDKTNSSAVIRGKADTNKYFGEKTIYFSLLKNTSKKVLNMTDIINRGIFVSYKNTFAGRDIKEIKDVKTEYVTFSDIVATKNESLNILLNTTVSICFGTVIFSQLNSQGDIQTPVCKYSKDLNLSNEIMKGLNVPEMNSEKSTYKESWNYQLGAWPFTSGVSSLSVPGLVHNETLDAVTLGNTWESTENSNAYEESTEVEMPPQTISIPQNNKLNVTASLFVEMQQVTLGLSQQIGGLVVANLVDTFNEEVVYEVSVRDMMQNLKQCELLPEEVVINDDDTVTFNGELVRTLRQGLDASIEYNIL